MLMLSQSFECPTAPIQGRGCNYFGIQEQSLNSKNQVGCCRSQVSHWYLLRISLALQRRPGAQVGRADTNPLEGPDLQRDGREHAVRR